MLVVSRQLVLDDAHQVEVDFSGLVLGDPLLDDGRGAVEPLIGVGDGTVIDGALAKSILDDK